MKNVSYKLVSGLFFLIFQESSVKGVYVDLDKFVFLLHIQYK